MAKRKSNFTIRSITYVHDPDALRLWYEFWVEKFIRESKL